MKFPIAALILGAHLALAASAVLPPDVQEFIERRDRCDHFLGEDPYDAGRAAYLDRAIEENCADTDRQLEALKRKYKNNETVRNALAAYDVPLEP